MEVDKLIPNQCAQFKQIMERLEVASGTPDFKAATDFWCQLHAALAPEQSTVDPRVALRLSDALIQFVVHRRLMPAAGGELFHTRNQGVGTGTVTMHPVVNALAKTGERLRKIVDELIAQEKSNDTGSATGLPMRMMKLLEESEGALEYVLGLGPGEKSPFGPRLVSREDRSVGNGT